MSTNSTASEAIRGTKVYMAPEQWSGEAVAATDQYALAIMAYQLLTGRLPCQGRPEQVMYQQLSVMPVPRSKLNSRLSYAIDAVILHALAKSINARFPSMHAFSVVASGSNFTFYINSDDSKPPVATVSDNTYTQGLIGLVADAHTNDTSVAYAFVRVWTLSS